MFGGHSLLTQPWSSWRLCCSVLVQVRHDVHSALLAVACFYRKHVTMLKQTTGDLNLLGVTVIKTLIL